MQCPTGKVPQYVQPFGSSFGKWVCAPASSPWRVPMNTDFRQGVTTLPGLQSGGSGMARQAETLARRATGTAERTSPELIAMQQLQAETERFRMAWCPGCGRPDDSALRLLLEATRSHIPRVATLGDREDLEMFQGAIDAAEHALIREPIDPRSPGNSAATAAQQVHPSRSVSPVVVLAAAGAVGLVVYFVMR